MATHLTRPTDTPPPASSPEWTDAPPQDGLIERQLTRARRQLKLMDLASSLIVLAVGTLAYLLALAIVDHWLLPLGAVGRWLGLAGLLLGIAGYIGGIVVPLLFRPINPLYAARSIEQGAPSLKNSLVNLLFLRGDRRAVHEAIYAALRERAARDLSLVELESIVDYRPVIRLGVILAVVFGLAALYLILSPKDPLQTVRRVTAPWADIAPPTQVQIVEVQPGDRDVFHGQTQRIQARVRGLAEGEAARLVFSTADGQTVDREVPMRLSDDGLHWEATLPVDATDQVDSSGLQQDLRYHVAAGDAVSARYRLHVLPSPTIIVKRVEYDFPDYTGRDDVVEQGRGDIRALEGTRVTIHAEANQPIGQAYIEFDPHLSGADRAGEDGLNGKPSGGKPTGTRSTLAMTSSGQTAQRSFTLRLAADRRSPDHDTYQVRFRTADGHESSFPVVHDIQVIPDLSPEVAVLTPTTTPVEVPEDGRQRIEVRAVDPDFGLSAIRLRAVAGGAQVLDHVLFEDASGRIGQTVVNFSFQPRSLGLTAGDRVTFWAVAEDNRTEPGGEQPAPNTQRTRNYQIIVLPPSRPEDASKPRDGQPGERSQQDEGKAGEEGEGGQQQGESGGEGPEGGAGEEGQKGQDGEGSQDGDADSGQRQPGSENSRDGAEGAGEGTQAGKGERPEDAPPSSQAAGEGGEPSPDASASDSPQDPGDDSTSGKGSGEPREGSQSGAGNRESGAGNESKPADSSGSDSASGAESSGGAGEKQGASGGSSKREEPLHDGEVIEKINELIEKEKQQQDAGGSEASGKDAASSPSEATQGGPREPGDPSDRSRAERREEGTANDAEQGQPRGDSSDADSPPNAQQEQRPEQTQPRDQGETADGGSERQSGPGGQAQGDRKRPDDKQPPDSERSPDANERQGGAGDNGESGAGQPADKPQGSAAAQGENRDREKTSDSPEQKPGESNEAQSPSNSKQQSDSQGGESGDRSGGGKQGPGQSANQKGNDSAGSNSPADSGASAAPEPGAGETADRAGDSQQADQPTGNAGDQAGAGSQSRENPQGNQPQSQPGREAGGDAAADQTDAARETTSDSPPAGTPRGPVRGGGRAGEGDQPPTGPPEGDVPDGDEANLDYARRATDLALEYLEEQQEQPDPKLLDELGWNQDDLKQFLDRWKRLKQDARPGDARGESEWENALRSLGLRPERSGVRRAGGADDALRGLRESGSRTRPPAAYRDLFEAYQKSASRRSDK